MADHAASDPDRIREYNSLIAEACERLDERLSFIRGDYDRGEITVREAADERIQVMTEHLTRLRLLREEYLR